MTARIRVDTASPYDVTVGRGLVGDGLREALAGADRVAVLHASALADLADAWAEGLEQEVTLVGLPDGERQKTASVLAACWGILAEAGFTRSDAVVGIGGGATTDLAGFVAATWLRGVRYVSIPTTVLGMVDAAIGGKTGINLPAGKNLVGAFYEPHAVLCDLDCLDSLPAADLRAGLAEVIKHGFIADSRTLELFEEEPAALLDPRSAALTEAIERSVRVKARVVVADLREATSAGKRLGREVLNYGHTLAHAIERRENYGWRHGDAVSVGLMFAATLSRILGRLDAAVVERHRSILESVGLPTRYQAGAWPELREAMNLDKKTRGSTLRLVLLDGVADPTIEEGPPEDALAAAYDEISG